MLDLLFTVLLWICAIGSGMVAGLFFAFSTFIMNALARLPAKDGIRVMQSINSTILSSLFMPLFFGTTLGSVLVAGLALHRWEGPGVVVTFAAAIVYVVGMFACTVALNVPLNNLLARVEPGDAGAAAVWERYLKEWTRWNHVRTLSSTIACGLFVAALITAQSH